MLCGLANEERKSRMGPKRLSIEPEGRDIFVVVDGKKIAKREQHKETWIPLEPGYVVTNSTGGDAIDIDYDGGDAPNGGGHPFSIRMNMF
jgi:hypothetical protein